MTTWIIPKTNTFTSLSLVETEHKELNLAADPCTHGEIMWNNFLI